MTQILEPGLLGPLLGQSAAAHNLLAPDYYVDATGGSDAADGLTSDTAWQTVAKVNLTSFNAGELVVFKRGETWVGGDDISWQSGTRYGPYGSGANPLVPGNWIVGLSVVSLGKVN